MLTSSIKLGNYFAKAFSTASSLVYWHALIASSRVSLATAADEMEAWRDERSDQWQESDKATKFEEKIEALREALETVIGLKM